MMAGAWGSPCTASSSVSSRPAPIVCVADYSDWRWDESKRSRGGSAASRSTLPIAITALLTKVDGTCRHPVGRFLLCRMKGVPPMTSAFLLAWPQAVHQ
jgi:hypothetical protein